jgi:hypothetical protein
MQPMMNDRFRVGFLIVGAQKAGTSALYEYLREHPEICMSRRKEVHFFDDDDLFEQDAADYAAYHSYFNLTPYHQIAGEATPIYMYWRAAPRRIWQYNPRMRILMLLRNPIERAYSHWNMERNRSAESLSFFEAITQERDRCRVALPQQHRLFSYVDRGYYSDQLREIWRFFPKSQTMVLRSEELRDDPKRLLDRVCKFLNVSLLESIEVKDVHRAPYSSQITCREWSYLKGKYEFGIKELERMLAWDCSKWLE